MRKFYAGVGSRSTPDDILAMMESVASALEADGWTLRSGGAKGADSAFEKGAKSLREVYIPWQGFNSRYQTVSGGDGFFVADRLPGWEIALETVNTYHPAPERLSGAAISLMARNAMQVLGSEITNPSLHSSFVLCWTSGGRDTGGTSQAIRIAKNHGIPVYNLGKDDCKDTVKKYIETGEAFHENAS